MIHHYGETDSEKRARENELCRHLVHELWDIGISERQRLFLIYLLATELENVEHMKSLTSLVKELGGADVFVSSQEPEQ